MSALLKNRVSHLMPEVLVVTHSDYQSFPMGGITTHCRNFLASIPSDRSAAAVGTTLSPSLRAGEWQSLELNGKPIDFFPLMVTSLQKFRRRRIPFKARVLPALWRHRSKLLAMGAPIYTHDVELTLPFLFPSKPVPVVMVRHGVGNFLQFYNPHLLRFQQFKNMYYTWEEWTIRRVDRLIVVSQEGFQYYTEEYPEFAYKIVYIPNGVDLSLFHPGNEQTMRRQRGLSDNQLVVFHAGRLTPAKNQIRLLRAFMEIKKVRPDAILLIAGTGEELKKLTSFVASHAIPGVHFLGELPHGDLAGLYNVADVFLLTSDWEGMPMVVLEALACGVPVVSTRVGAVPQIVESGTCGFICDEWDPGVLAQATLQAATHRKQMQPACISAAYNFSAEHMTLKIFDVFDELRFRARDQACFT